MTMTMQEKPALVDERVSNLALPDQKAKRMLPALDLLLFFS